MGTLRDIVLYVHLIGFALLLGGAAAQYFSGKIRINQAMLAGVVIQLVTGLILAAPWGLDPGEKFNPAAVVTKLVVAVLIAIMVIVPRKRDAVNRGHFLGIVGLILVNAGVAVFWL